MMLPPLVLVLQAILWSNRIAAPPGQTPSDGNGQLRKPAEALGMMKVRCVILFNEAEIGHTLEFPSPPLTIPKGPAKSKISLRFFDVRSMPVPTTSTSKVSQGGMAKLSAGDALAEVHFTLAELLPFGVPLYTSLWLGLQEKQPGQPQVPAELHESLVRARDVSVPKVAVTIFKPAPLARPTPKAASVPGTPAAPQPDLDGALVKLLEEKNGGLDFGCTANRTLHGPSLRDQVRGVMESVKVANTMTYSLQVAVWKRQQEGDPLAILMGDRNTLGDVPLEEVERALRKSKETDQVLQDKYGKKFECTQTALERALKANSDLEVERQNLKSQYEAEIEKLRTELATAREESNRTFQRATDLVEELESVRTELLATRRQIQAHDEHKAHAHQHATKMDEEMAAVRAELEAERAAKKATLQEVNALREEIDGHRDSNSTVAKEIAVLRAELDAERASKDATLKEAEALRREVQDEKSAAKELCIQHDAEMEKSRVDAKLAQEEATRAAQHATDLVKELEAVRNDLLSAKRQIADHDEHKATAHQHASKLDLELSAVRAELEAERGAKNATMQEVAALREEVDGHRDANSAVSKEIAVLRSELDSERTAKAATLKEVAALRAELEEESSNNRTAAKEAKLQHEAEVGKLKGELGAARDEADRSFQRATDLVEELESVRTELLHHKARSQENHSKLDDEMKALRGELEAERAAKKATMDEASVLRTEVDEEKAAKLSATKEAAALKAELEAEKAAKKASLQEVERNSQRAADLVDELESVRTELIQQKARSQDHHSKMDQDIAGVRMDLESERAARKATNEEVQSLRAELQEERSGKLMATKEVAGLKAELDAEKAAKQASLHEADTLRAELVDEKSGKMSATKALELKTMEKESCAREAEKLKEFIQELQTTLTEEQGKHREAMVKVTQSEYKMKSMAMELEDIKAAQESERALQSAAAKATAAQARADARIAEITAEVDELRHNLTVEADQRMKATRKLGTLEMENEHLKATLEQQESISRQSLASTKSEVSSLLGEVAALKAAREEDQRHIQKLTSDNKHQTRQLEDMRHTYEQENAALEVSQHETSKLQAEIASLMTAKAEALKQAEHTASEARSLQRQVQDMELALHRDQQKLQDTSDHNAALQREITQLSAARDAEAHRVHSLQQESLDSTKELETLRKINEQEREMCQRARDECERLRDEVSKVSQARAEEAQRAEALLDEGRERMRELETLRAATDQERQLTSRVRDEASILRDEIAKLAAARAEEAQRADTLLNEGLQQTKEIATLRAANEEERKESARSRNELDRLREDLRDVGLARVEESERAKVEMERMESRLKELTSTKDKEVEQMKAELERLREEVQVTAADRAEAMAKAQEAAMNSGEEMAAARQKIQELEQAASEKSSALIAAEERLQKEIEQLKEEAQMELARQVGMVQTKLEEKEAALQNTQLESDDFKTQLSQRKEELQALEVKLDAAVQSTKAADAQVQQLKEEQLRLEEQLQAAMKDAENADLTAQRLREGLKLSEDEMATLREQEIAVKDKQLQEALALKQQSDERSQQLLKELQTLREEFEKEQQQHSATESAQLQAKGLQIEQLKQEKDEADNKFLQLQQELEQVKQKMALDQEQHSASEAAESQARTQQMDMLRQEKDIIEAQFQELKQDLEQAKQDLELSKRELENAKQELSQEQQHSARGQGHAAEAEQLRLDKNALEEKCEILKQELEHIRQELQQEQQKTLQELERSRRQSEAGGTTAKTVADLRLQLQKAKQAHKDDLARFKGLEPGLKMMEQQKDLHAEEVTGMSAKIEKLEAQRAELQAELDGLRLQAGTSREKLQFLKSLVGRQQDTMATKGLSPSSMGTPSNSLLRTDSGAIGFGAASSPGLPTMTMSSADSMTSGTPRTSPTHLERRPSGLRSRLGGLPISSDPALPTAAGTTPRGTVIVVSQGRRGSKMAPGDPTEFSKDLLVLKIFRRLVIEKFCQLSPEDLNKGLKLDSNPAFINRADLLKVMKKSEGAARSFTFKKAFHKFDPSFSGKVNGDQFKQMMEVHFRMEADPSNQLWLLIVYIIREPSHPLFPWGASKKGGTGLDTPRGSETLTEGEFCKLLDHPRLTG